MGNGVGGLIQSLSEAIGGLISGLVHAFQAAVQGVFQTFSSVLPFPWWLIVMAAFLLGAAWFLAKR